MIPRKISRRPPNELSITWDDGHDGRHTMPVLRRYCPCAACKVEATEIEESTLFPILHAGQFELTSIEQVGNYALQLFWADGHRTGIYTFSYLRQLCECHECASISSE